MLLEGSPSANSPPHGRPRNDSQAKAFYQFLANETVSQDDLIHNMAANCQACVADRPLLCSQDSSEINLANHRNRLEKDDPIGLTDGSKDGPGFFIHPSLVIDAQTLMNPRSTPNKPCPPPASSLSFKIGIGPPKRGDIYEQFCLVPHARPYPFIDPGQNQPRPHR